VSEPKAAGRRLGPQNSATNAYYRLVVPLTGGSYAGVRSGSSVTSITYDHKSNNSDLIVKIKR
jgi:hypothetical protein